MRFKIEGALILCIVAGLAKTCLEKFTPKVRRTSYNLLPVKTLVHHVYIRRIEKHFLTRSSFNMYLYSAKISISIFWSVPTYGQTVTLREDDTGCQNAPTWTFNRPQTLVFQSNFLHLRQAVSLNTCLVCSVFQISKYQESTWLLH